MAGEREVDQLSGVETTGHVWDGIRELNNPMPRWWLWTLYATIVFAIGYTVAYPAWPGLTAATTGMFGWSSRADLRHEISAASQAHADELAKLGALDINGILADESLRTYAVSAGASIFKVYCTQCHGSGAQGAPGYPNLNDDSWLWGGRPEQIVQTIAHGVRDPSDGQGRASEMPSFGRDSILDSAQITAVANHVRKLSGQEFDAAAAAAGGQVFVDNCVSCHGANGEGNNEFGAPQLNDALWLRGGDIDSITRQIKAPTHGMMPAWQSRLGETRVKQLAAYVLSLGGGQ